MGTLIKHKEKELLALIDSRCCFSNVAVLTDLGDRMIYDKQYKTASSLIFGACVVQDTIDYRAYANHTDVVRISVELGWKRGYYLNFIVDVMNTSESERYEFIFLSIINAVQIFNPSRKVSDEEREAISRVLDKMILYDIAQIN